MRRFRSLIGARTLAGLLCPVLLASVLIANLMTPFAPLATFSTDVAGLDDSNSVVICTDDGWKRISFAELGIESAADLDGDYCAEYCSLCVIALAGHFLAEPDFAFLLQANDQATRLSIQRSQAILSAIGASLNQPRAPPAFS